MVKPLDPQAARDGSWKTPLSRYDSERCGPLFAVSDEGSAATAVANAAQTSAKARALWPADAMTRGVALDGERMTSAGEAPIGPEEYADLLAAGAGKLLCTTNVGVRANARLCQPLPEFTLHESCATDAAWLDGVCSAFTSFVRTPDQRPRPRTVRLALPPGGNPAWLQRAVAALNAARAQGRIGALEFHKLSAMIAFEKVIGNDESAQVAALFAAARAAGIDEVAVDGGVRAAARQRAGVQSLLNVLDLDQLQHLFGQAKAQAVKLSYRFQLDVETAARTIWTGLHTAQTHGFSAGKYGLVPMTLPEQARVIELITRWCAGWSAIPAFYVDTPLLTADTVYGSERMAEAADLWLETARGAGATIVLFDSPDRISPRRLLRSSDEPDDPGVLTMSEIEQLLATSRDLGVRVLWSGGITSRQALELARRRVFGIFSTSSTATKVAVTAAFADDHGLAAENEPTELGVRRMHAIIQGGFLGQALTDHDDGLAQTIGVLSEELVALEQDAPNVGPLLGRLDASLERGWTLLARTAKPTSAAGAVTHEEVPVPANAVRVFRGIRRADLPHSTFVDKLGAVFVPVTVQMQRLYGLTAYLPAIVPPRAGPEVPDEVALVFYRTQAAYHDAKRCIGGRAYSELHELVFDMRASRSEFPRLWAGKTELDTAYHLLRTSVDWQLGTASLYIGSRRKGVTSAELMASATATATEVQKAPAERDAVIFCVTESCILWWEHARGPLAPRSLFDGVCDKVYGATPRPLTIAPELTRQYSGVHIDEAGDALSTQFTRT